MSLYSVKVSLKLRAGVAQRPIFALVKRTREKEKVSSNWKMEDTLRICEKVSFIWKMEDTFCRFMYMYFSIVQEDFQGAHPAPRPKSCNVTYDFAGASYSFTIYG